MMSARRQQDGPAAASCVRHATRNPRRDVIAWLAHDLYFSHLGCVGEPCDLDAPCFRHKNLFAIAERLLRRARALAAKNEAQLATPPASAPREPAAPVDPTGAAGLALSNEPDPLAAWTSVEIEEHTAKRQRELAEAGGSR